MASAPETIGERLRRLRTERGLTQKEIAAPGVSDAYISRIEEGERNPSLRALRLLADKLGVTLEHLETGREIPLELEREYQLTSAELELRLGGDAEAEQTLRRLAAAEPRGRSSARARAALGVHAAQRGEYEAAIGQLEAAMAAGIRPRERPDVYEALASCYLASGASTKGIALLERCLAATATDPILQTRYRAQLGLALHARGDAQRARAMVEQAVALADEFAAPRLRVYHYRALAHAAWAKRTPEPALAHARRALVLLEALDDARQLAHSQRLCGELCGLEHEWEQALRHLNRAERLLEQTGDTEQLGTVRAEQAKALAGLGLSDAALAHASEAAELLTADHRLAPAADHALALAQAAAGDIDSADQSFLRASQAYEQRQHWRQAAAVAHDWGNTLRQAHRPEQALDAFSRAARYTAREWSGRSASDPEFAETPAEQDPRRGPRAASG
jgi:transcriptional regulator with XRE-family HTH domain